MTDTPQDDVDLRQRYYNQPLMVSEDIAQYLQANIGVRMRRPTAQGVLAALPVFGVDTDRSARRPYALEDGVALINIKGALEHDSAYYGNAWTGYDAIRARYDMALDDPEVRGIALMINSGGGMVSGNFDLADHIYQHRGDKPTLAIVDEHAYSAAYSLASAADKIVVARTGGVGSIGVLTVHFDLSKMLSDAGIGATIIRAGKHKAKPNMLEALDATTLARVQASIDQTYDLFVATVARNRGLNSDDVRNTEAATFGAEEAIELGLADAIQAPLAALAAFKRELSGSLTTGATAMSTANSPGAPAQHGQAATYTQEQFTQEQLTQEQFTQALTTAKTEAKAEGLTEGMEQGATAERERIFAIIECEAAQGRAASAAHLAKQPAMTADTAAQILAGLPASPGSVSGAAADVLTAAMALTGGGADVGSGEGQDNPGAGPVIIDANAIYDRINTH